MTLIIFDLETTGLSPRYHEIIQIAAVKVKVGCWEPLGHFDSFVRPQARMPRFITGLTGISQAQVERAPTPAEALQAFSQFIGEETTLVAHNGPGFDMRFIAENCTRHGLPVRPTAMMDSRAFSRKIWGGRSGHGLDPILHRLGLSSDGVKRHDARGDVHLLAQAVRKMWGQLAPDFQSCPVELKTGVIPALVPAF
ncbi:3'-5' exonuclease [Prosthecobacter dejongeii]|uniref:DNA polymerase III alpha subunit (Gram-positive type) n=1 Tax=Prosthecobacter dejongeii TaxID=48465 RepID=A0A7W8DNU2_9BACT|nr:3'-5' exonuclease [Prosthecobacter dejongeii]MBB5036455.1 DNA polymerase III alpha subunit (gram-positive type) [Prosthecobacter dejongeii]